MREDPIISGAWVKAALVVLVGGALGVGAYLLASGADIDLPEIDLDTTPGTTISNTTQEDTTIDRPTTTPASEPKPEQPKPSPAPPAAPSIEQLRELNRCIAEAAGDIDRISACFDRFGS